MAEFRLETERLVLRGWREGDAARHHAICNDPRVAATLGTPPDITGSREIVARGQASQAANGYCFWVMERKAVPGMIGWCGLLRGRAPIEGQVEIGWTLDPEYWGQGLVNEAARACLDWAWHQAGLASVTAITSRGNLRSRRVMERLGMREFPDESFDHPALATDDSLSRHVLYRIARPQ